jgi:hypothetical protein
MKKEKCFYKERMVCPICTGITIGKISSSVILASSFANFSKKTQKQKQNSKKPDKPPKKN